METFRSRNADEHVGRPVIEHWAPEWQAIIAERIRQRSLGLPLPTTFEGVAQRQDGSRFPVHIAVTLVNLSDGPASVGFITDITERRQAEDANTRLAAIVESSEDAIISKTPDGIILTWNHGAEKLFGYTAQEAVGRNMLLIIPPDRSNEELEILARIARGETVDPFETVRLTKSGRPIQVSVTTSPIRNADGQIMGASKIVRDISERKQAEEALRRARDELARANAQLERKVAKRTAQLAEANANLETFTHTAAHDLRAPLRGITSFAQLLAAEYGERLDEMGCSMLERLQESARQMGQLLSDLLEYSRVSQQELRLEKVKLEGAVEEALALLETDIRSKQAEVRVDGPLPEVVAHPATAVMLISNLVSNALKFVPQKVKPQVRIWAQPMSPPEGAVYNEQRAESGFVRLCVEDNGIGIAPEDLGKMFETFQHLHGKNVYPGTGLGLAIVRRGAERMGGRAGVESELGKGSRFWIELKA
jgi:PAS domain S-box-containing protein